MAEGAERPHAQSSLANLLTEARILLPGTQVFLAVLTTLPFTSRFGALDHSLRIVFLCTFFMIMTSLVLFLFPAAYHRIARPIRHRDRFEMLANVAMIAGLVPLSLALILVTYFITAIVMESIAAVASCLMAIVVAALWWAIPLLRLHDRFRPPTLTPRRFRHGDV